MIHDLECKEDSTVNTILKTMKINNIKSFEECRNKCQQNVKCDFLNFKVESLEFGFHSNKKHFRTMYKTLKHGPYVEHLSIQKLDIEEQVFLSLQTMFF